MHVPHYSTVYPSDSSGCADPKCRILGLKAFGYQKGGESAKIRIKSGLDTTDADHWLTQSGRADLVASPGMLRGIIRCGRL